MKEVKILYIEDEHDAAEELQAILQELTIEDYSIKVDIENDFSKGLETIKSKEYNIIILDLCDNTKGNQDISGKGILSEVQKDSFTPIIFYSGHAHKIGDINSDIVKVISKGGDGSDILIKSVQNMIKCKLAILKKAIHDHIDNELNNYFWSVIHPRREIFKSSGLDYSLSYLLLRRIANSLSKDGIIDIISDPLIQKDKIHPMEFYIYPTKEDLEYSFGEILEKDNQYYIIITPTCDFQERKGKRNVEHIVLNKTIKLTDIDCYNNYVANQSKTSKESLEKYINNNNPRYHFLPKTSFIPNLVMDFQDKILIKYEDLKKYKRLTTLDSPFTESMLIRHISYYNRIGTPDLDAEYILNHL